MKERCCALHGGVVTGEGHCCIQVVLLVATAKQGLNPALAFPCIGTPLFNLTEATWKLFANMKTSMFAAAKAQKFPVFETKNITNWKD